MRPVCEISKVPLDGLIISLSPAALSFLYILHCEFLGAADSQYPVINNGRHGTKPGLQQDTLCSSSTRSHPQFRESSDQCANDDCRRHYTTASHAAFRLDASLL